MKKNVYLTKIYKSILLHTDTMENILNDDCDTVSG